MFTRSKTYESRSPYSGRSERTYYYLVESYREGEKVHQRTVAYLGKYPTLAEALAGIPADIERKKNNAAALLQRDETQRAETHKGAIPKKRLLEMAQSDGRAATKLEEQLAKLQAVTST